MTESTKKISDKLMAELRTGYRALKGNARATDTEIADYLYTAFHLASHPAAGQEGDDCFEGFYVKSEEAAQYTAKALHQIRTTLFSEEIPTSFVRSKVNSAQTSRIALSQSISESTHKKCSEKLKVAMGIAPRLGVRERKKPVPHDPAQNQLIHADFLLYSTFLQLAFILAEAPKREDGATELSEQQMKLLTPILRMLYPNSAVSSMFSTLFKIVKVPNTERRIHLLSEDVALKIFSDMGDVIQQSERYGERYLISAFKAIAAHDGVPVNPEFQPIRDFLEATRGLHLDGNRLYFDKIYLEKTDAAVRKLILPEQGEQAIQLKEGNYFQLSDEAAEAYKAAIVRARHFIANGKPAQVARELAKTSDDKPLFTGKTWDMQKPLATGRA